MSAAQGHPKGGWCDTHGGFTGERCGGFQYDGVACESSAAITLRREAESLRRDTRRLLALSRKARAEIRAAVRRLT